MTRWRRRKKNWLQVAVLIQLEGSGESMSLKEVDHGTAGANDDIDANIADQ